MHPYRTASDRSDVADPRYRVTRTTRRLVKLARWLRLAWYWERKTKQHSVRMRRKFDALINSAVALPGADGAWLKMLLHSYGVTEYTVVDGKLQRRSVSGEELADQTVPIPLSPDGAHAVVTKMAEKVHEHTLTSKYSSKRPPKTPPRPLPPPKKIRE